jgi:maleylpyruvate isomerase
MQPDALIDLGCVGHRRFVQTVAGLRDTEFAGPSLLPAWSRADVVAWLALKSESHTHLFEGAAAGEVRQQFPDGYDQLAAIAREVAQGVPALRLRLGTALSDLEAAWERLPTASWSFETITSAGRRSMADVVARHLRDVEVHHVDLDAGYGPMDWPEQFVELELAKRLADLPGRTPHAALLAWLLGRAQAPDLGPW